MQTVKPKIFHSIPGEANLNDNSSFEKWSLRFIDKTTSLKGCKVAFARKEKFRP
jgi:hypothetical protein